MLKTKDGYAKVIGTSYLGSSDYLLLSNGDSKAISSLSVNYATSAGNADTLDGVHLNGIFTAFLANGNATRLVIGGVTKDLTIPYASLSPFLYKNSTFNSTGLAGLQYYDGDMSNTTNNNSWSVPSSGWHLILHLPLSVSGYFTELSFPVNDVNGLAWRLRRSNSYYGWYRILDSNNYSSYVKKIGTSTVGSSSIPIYLNAGTPTLCSTTLGVSITGNAATASTLKTTRTLWGLSFNGSANISGTLSGVAHILFSADNTYDIGSDSAASRYIYTYWLGAKSGLKLELGANNSGFGLGLCIDTNLNVGIGTNAPAYKLDVKGDIRATGQIIRNGSSLGWVNGRKGALLRETTSAGYHTLWSLKTTNGSWDFGEYNSSGWNNIPVLSYITDTNFNSGNNTTTYQIRFPLDSGTIALTKNIPTSLPANGGNADTVDGVHVKWAGAITETEWLAAWENYNTIRCIAPANVSVGNADKVDGVHANQLCRIYTFNVHNSIIKVGTLTSGQAGHVCKLRFNSGISYNATNTDKTMTVIIRASNGGANSNGFYFEAHSESYRGGAFTTFYLYLTSKTQCELYMAAFNYSGLSIYEISFSNGDSWTNEISVQNALPTSNIFTLPNYQIAYTDYNVASATKVIVNLNTTNDANYPLVWSNLSNTNTVTENQLYKSWSDLYYNPKNKRLTVGGSVIASSFVKSGGTSLQLLRADGGIATFNWSGQSGLPTWLWGGNNLHSYYVYNPSNFRVAYASSAGNADTVDGTHLNGIFTAFGNNAHNITATIGGVTKSFLVNWAADSDKLDGYHADKYLMVPTIIDATSLNSDTYYPVTILLPCKNTRIEVEVSLDSGTKPSWSTHQQGFTSRKVWESNGSGWGTTSVERNIFVSTYSYASEDPIRGIGQLTNASVEFVYVRGGGKYYFRVSVGGGTPTLRKENYTINSQSVAPTKTAPDLIVPCINTPHRRVTLWGQSFNGTNNVSGSLSNTGTITASAAATYDIGSNALDYRNGYFQWIGAKSNTNLRLAANNSDNQIVLHTNGNVGIGTASPAYKLYVVGDIYTTTGFKKNGSSNSYILLGGGDHKLISDFATSNHTHPLYLPLAGGTMTGTIRFNNLISIDSAIVLDYKYSAGGFARDIVSMKNSVYGDANLGALSILCYPDSTSNGFLYIYLGTDKYDGPNNLRIYKDKVTFGNNILIDAGNIGSLTVDKSYHLRINASGTWSTWYWLGQSGQPNWLWGSNDGINMYVWNPSNFRVEYASSAGNADTVDGVHMDWSTNYTEGSYLAIWDNAGNCIRPISKGSTSVGYASTAGSVAWDSITGRPNTFTPSAHDHNYVLDIANNSHTTFAYSKSGLSKDSITWLAVWNGYELRAMNKDQIALADHTHDDRYLKLEGGTMNGNARIGHGSGNLYIGNSGNDGWIYTQDIASQLGTNNWFIKEPGAAHFGNIYICTYSDYVTYSNSVVECYNDTLYLNYYSSRGISLCYGGGNVGVGTTNPSYKLDVNGLMRASGFHHANHDNNDSVLLAGGGYSQGVPVRYWAIYLIYIGVSVNDTSYTKRSGNHDFITSYNWLSEGIVTLQINFPPGYNKTNTLIFGNGDHQISHNWTTPVYVTIITDRIFGSESQIRVLLSNDSSLDTGYANIYFMCMG